MIQVFRLGRIDRRAHLLVYRRQFPAVLGDPRFRFFLTSATPIEISGRSQTEQRLESIRNRRLRVSEFRSLIRIVRPLLNRLLHFTS
jgi:hypothetical protein